MTDCFDLGTIQWSPLKNLGALESLSNGQVCDFSRFSQDSGFWKLPGRFHPVFTCSKSTIETLDKVPNMFKSNNKEIRTTLTNLDVVNLDYIRHIVLEFPSWTLNNEMPD